MAAAMAQGVAVMRSSFLGAKPRTAIRAAAPAAAPVRSLQVFAAQKVKSWLPGSDPVPYLEGLPANFGFDPLGFGKTKSNLERFQQSELIHARWAMLGVAGVLLPELLGFGNWIDAPKPYLAGGTGTYFGIPVPFTLPILVAIEFVAIAWAELARGQADSQDAKTYPGGAFDPLGFSKGANLEELKVKELKNGRLAMVAFLGFVVQAAVTGQGPLANLAAHIADPWGVNAATNGALPFVQ
eukprot:jgi/Chlat1/8111/Chrsp75S07575